MRSVTGAEGSKLSQSSLAPKKNEAFMEEFTETSSNQEKSGDESSPPNLKAVGVFIVAASSMVDALLMMLSLLDGGSDDFCEEVSNFSVNCLRPAEVVVVVTLVFL